VTDLKAEIDTLETTANTAELRRSGCSKTLKEVEADRQNIYQIRKEEARAARKEKVKGKLVAILGGAGAGIVGIGIGILIGVFAI